MRHLLAVSVCIAILLVILTLGLWPFHAPRNAVSWLQDRNGLRFGDYGTVMSSGAFQQTASPNHAACSIEIWIESARAFWGGTILAFYDPPDPLRLSLHQAGPDLLIQARAASASIDEILRRSQPVFVTITSGTQGTSLYVNGAFAKTARQLRLGSECTGRLILGDRARSQDTWSGDLKGVAVYYRELPAPAVLRHYNAWRKSGQPAAAPDDRAVGLYCFDERSGTVVRNQAGPSLDLAIPERYVVLDQILFEPFWKEFDNSWGYWGNVLKNIVGFVPLGFCFYAYFSLFRPCRRAVLITVLCGTAVSLTIEVLQGFLPTRQSGTTDLFTNTLGAYVGVLSYRAFIRFLADRLPWWNSFTSARQTVATIGTIPREDS